MNIVIKKLWWEGTSREQLIQHPSQSEVMLLRALFSQGILISLKLEISQPFWFPVLNSYCEEFFSYIQLEFPLH